MLAGTRGRRLILFRCPLRAEFTDLPYGCSLMSLAGCLDVRRLKLLTRGPEQNLVHIHFRRLADREGDCPRK
jgi:hypothetical protein